MGVYAITGAGGYIGQRLIKYLNSYDDCDSILAIDVKPPTINSEKTVYIERDVRDSGLAGLLGGYGVTCMIHLAFVVNPMHDEKKMYDINVNGTRNILKVCEELKIGHVIFASSATAYGAYRDNPEFFKEDAPIRTYPPSFNYAHHKGINEGYFKEFMEKHPEVIFNIIRPSIVYGANVDNYLSRFFKLLPVGLLLDGNDPLFQFVHEDDVARLLIRLVEKKVPGAFNVAPDGVIRYSEVLGMLGKRSISFPRWLAMPVAGLLWKLRYLEMPRGALDYTAFPWSVDNSRSKELLDFEYQYDTVETLKLMFKTHGYRMKA
ncbi:MAG: NAD-dependent epimerase/dehydratase family protein [Bacillota bacterium]